MDCQERFRYVGNRPNPSRFQQQQVDLGCGCHDYEDSYDYVYDHNSGQEGGGGGGRLYPGFGYSSSASTRTRTRGFGCRVEIRVGSGSESGNTNDKVHPGFYREDEDANPLLRATGERIRESRSRGNGQEGGPFPTPQDGRGQQEPPQPQPQQYLGSLARTPPPPPPPAGQISHHDEYNDSSSRPGIPSEKFSSSTSGGEGGGLPLIFRMEDGRYDQRTITYSGKSGRGRSRAGSPASLFRPLDVSHQQQQREDSSGAYNFTEPSASAAAYPSSSRPRTNSTTSRRSSAASSHRSTSSIRDIFRRGSEQLVHAAASMLLPLRQHERASSSASSSRRRYYFDQEEIAPTPPSKGEKPTPAERAAKLCRDKERAYRKEAARYAGAADHRLASSLEVEMMKDKEKVKKAVGNTPGGIGDWKSLSKRHADQSGNRLSSTSSSPSYARDVDEEDYVKLVGSHKILRVRQTVYCDPGNPFDLGSPEDVEPCRSSGISPAMTNSSGFNPELRTDLNRSPAATDSSGFNLELEKIIGHSSSASPSSSDSAIENVVHRRGSPDVGMERFSNRLNAPLYGPRARRPGTPALVRAHSMKEVSIPVAPSPLPEEEEYIPPRSLWRKSLPFSNLCEANGRVADGVRDTKFYGLYDGVLAEYWAGLDD